MRMVSRGVLTFGAAFCLLWSCVGRAEEPKSAKIAWMEDARVALATAKDAGRPIVIYVTSENCHYCRLMERDTWSKPSVASQITKDCVALKIMAEKQPQIVEHLRVRAYPTTLLLSAEGKLIKATEGYVTPAEMNDLLSARRYSVAATSAAGP